MASTIIIYRDRLAGCWCGTFSADTCKGSITATFAYSSVEKAGDVARAIQHANPNSKIGIRSESIGPFCVRDFGPVIWLRNGWC